MILEIVANKEDRPFYNIQHYVDCFTKLVSQEERALAKLSNDDLNKTKQLQILAIEKANLKLAREVAGILVPDVVRECDLSFKNTIKKAKYPVPNYYYGMLKEEYIRSQRIFRTYKKILLGLPVGDIKFIDNEYFYIELMGNKEILHKHFVSGEKKYSLDDFDNIALFKKLVKDRDSLSRDCRRLLKSIYLFEQALRLKGKK